MPWDFSPDPSFQPQLEWVARFVRDEIEPLEHLLPTVSAAQQDRLLSPLKAQVKERGLWAAHLPVSLGGTGLGQLPLCEMNLLTGRVGIAMDVFGNMAPDSGNAELLAEGGTDEQKERWLWPNLRGDLRSAFALTEPCVAGSDPTQIQTVAVRDGDEWVLDGRKWMITHASLADFLLVMAVTDPDAAPHERCSMLVVERGTPGMEVTREIPTMHHLEPVYGARGNHGEVVFTGCRVPAGNLVGRVGGGFALAQTRLGPGRLHHAARWLSQAERAFDMLGERALSRSSFGRSFADHQLVQDAVAESRIELEQAKLLTLRTAWKFDREGGRATRADIAMTKVVAARVLHNVVDRALQVHGSLGYSGDLPLEAMYRAARMAPLVDGADEVHKVTIARTELRRYQGVEGWPTEHVPTRLADARRRFAHLLETCS